MSDLERWLRRACVLALAALGLMMWSIVDPSPIPVIVSMSVGQALGTLSFAIFAVVVVVDFRRNAARRGAAPPASDEDTP